MKISYSTFFLIMNRLILLIILLYSCPIYAESLEQTKVWGQEVEASIALVTQYTKVKIEPSLILSMIHQESRGDNRARSSVGAFGLMQLTPATAQELAFMLDVSLEELKEDPALNILAGTLYFAILKKKYKSDKKALIAYNAGERNLLTGNWSLFAETRHYLKVILRKQHYFRDS